MLEQVEALEHHAGGEALARDLAVGQRIELVADAAEADQLAVDPDGAAVEALELVDAAQERALARAGRADDAQHLAARQLQRDVVDGVQVAEGLAHLPRREDRLAHAAASTGRGARAVFWPLAKCRSRKCWPMLSTVTTARYHPAATNSSSITWSLA